MRDLSNVSSLFQSSNTNGLLGSINLSDYSLIKTGGYKKLLKSYYADSDTSQSANSSSTAKKTTDYKDTTGLSQMKNDAEKLSKAVDSLESKEIWKSNGEVDRDKLAKAVSTFVDTYNSTVDQAAKVNSKDVTNQLGYMENMTSTMSKLLEKVGITVGSDNKLSLNETTLKNADAKNLKALFGPSKQTFASQIKEKANAIASAAVKSSSLYSQSGLLSNTMTSQYNNWV